MMIRLKGVHLLLFLYLILGIYAVDRNNFKTCDQSGFCKRLRKTAEGDSRFALDIDSIAVDGAKLTAELANLKNNVGFLLEINSLTDGTFRMVINEKDPLYSRYRTLNALHGEPKLDGELNNKNKTLPGSSSMGKKDGDIRLIDLSVNREEKTVSVSNRQGHKVLINVDPLKVVFLDLEGNPAVVINNRGLQTIEHLRKKNEPNAVDAEHSDGEQEVDEPKSKDEDGMWDEYFKSHHDTKPRGPEALSLDVTFPDAANVYGIPQHADKFALRSTKSMDPYRLYNLDVFEYEMESPMALYGSVPVLYAHGSKRSVGVFWLNSAETWVDIENSADNSNVVSSIVNFVSGGSSTSQSKQHIDALFMSESGVFDVFVLMGPGPGDTFRQYTALTGTAVLPQFFSLAYHQCRWNYNDEDDVKSVSEGFDLHDIPNDVIWLDIEYTDQKKYFTWDPRKFAHPEDMIKNLTSKGRKLVVIIDPHIKRESGYFMHEDATNNGYYVKNRDNKDYEGWCWPGSSSYLDHFDPKVTSYYSAQYAFDKFPGTTKDVHLWNDMNEPSVFNGPEITMPKDNIHFGDWEHRHVHNEYGLVFVKASYEGLLARTDGVNRAFILSRALFPGTQRYAAIWTGDNMSEWPHLAASLPMCLSIAVSGISFCGADIGGFFGNPNTELLTRWYQAGAFLPFFRAHAHIDTKRREPWLFDEQTTKLIRDAIRKRYSYLPFWYTLFYEHTVNGYPVMRPLYMHYPKDEETFTIENEFLLGDQLLVRPVTEAAVTSVSVYLPGQNDGHIWYDIDSYAKIAPGKISQEVNLAKIPIYQRGGTIIPKKERMRRSSALMHDDPYTLVIALDTNNTASGSLYIDDGETFDYQKGKYIYAKIDYKDHVLTYSFPDESSVGYPTRSWLERVVIAGIGGPPKYAHLRKSKDNPSEPPTVLQVTYHRGNDVLVVRKPAVSMGQEFKIEFQFIN